MPIFPPFEEKSKSIFTRVCAVVILTAILASCLIPTAFAQTTYVITDGDDVKVYTTYATDPESILNQVGVTLNEDDTLSINEEAFKSANMTTVKSLFNNTGSYAYKASAQASLIDFAAENESSKANTYTMNGTYGNNYSMGSIMDTWF